VSGPVGGCRFGALVDTWAFSSIGGAPVGTLLWALDGAGAWTAGDPWLVAGFSRRDGSVDGGLPPASCDGA
jgi:hypothetical protein